MFPVGPASFRGSSNRAALDPVPGGGGGGSIALVAHTAFTGTGSGGGTTSGIDTTGANFIVIALATFYLANTPPTDSNGNTYLALSAQPPGGSGAISQLWYCASPTVGAGHTFTTPGAGYPGLAVAAFSGVNASPFDNETGASGASISSLATGSLTPSQNNSLVISAMAALGGSSGPYLNNAMTITDYQAETGASVGIGLAYVIQTAAVAVNPTWSWTGAVSEVSATIASIKP